jgi:hypothetical protein
MYSLPISIDCDDDYYDNDDYDDDNDDDDDDDVEDQVIFILITYIYCQIIKLCDHKF